MLTLIVGAPGTGKTHIYRNKLHSLIPNTDGNPSIFVSKSDHFNINDEEIKYQMMNARNLGIRYIVESQRLSEIPLDVIKCANYCIFTDECDANEYAKLVDISDSNVIQFTFNNGSKYPFVLFDRVKNTVLSHSD